MELDVYELVSSLSLGLFKQRLPLLLQWCFRRGLGDGGLREGDSEGRLIEANVVCGGNRFLVQMQQFGWLSERGLDQHLWREPGKLETRIPCPHPDPSNQKLWDGGQTSLCISLGDCDDWWRADTLFQKEVSSWAGPSEPSRPCAGAAVGTGRTLLPGGFGCSPHVLFLPSSRSFLMLLPPVRTTDRWASRPCSRVWATSFRVCRNLSTGCVCRWKCWVETSLGERPSLEGGATARRSLLLEAQLPAVAESWPEKPSRALTRVTTQGGGGTLVVLFS